MLLTDERNQISRAAYQKAWQWLVSEATLTPDERLYAPNRLRQYIRSLINMGETNADRAAHQAIGLVRQFETILRSRSEIDSPSIEPR